MNKKRFTEDDVLEAAAQFDAEMSSAAGPLFSREQIDRFNEVMNEPDVIERARKSHALGLSVLREAEESQRRYEEMIQQSDELGLELDEDMDGNAIRARQSAATDYADRVEAEVASEVRRLFSQSLESTPNMPAMPRGLGRMRI